MNLSELFWVKLLGKGLPSNILVRESLGFIAVFVYLFVLPVILIKTKLKGMYKTYGPTRFVSIMIFGLGMLALPIKMYLRWAINLKYIVAIPEWFFNI